MCSLGPSQSEIRPWTLVTELGIDYADATQPEQPRLTAPVVATRGADGSYLIVDEICAEKPIPFRLEYRSICLDAQGAVLFDSRDMGLADAYGCWVDGDTIALLRRTQWALELVNRVGDTTTRIDLTTFSKCLPRIVVATDEDSFLAVFLDRSSRLDIVEFDRSGRLRWFLPRSVDFLGVPTSIQKLAGGTF